MLHYMDSSVLNGDIIVKSIYRQHLQKIHLMLLLNKLVGKNGVV